MDAADVPLQDKPDSEENHSNHEQQTEPSHSEPCSSENQSNHEQQTEPSHSEQCSSETNSNHEQQPEPPHSEPCLSETNSNHEQQPEPPHSEPCSSETNSKHEQQPEPPHSEPCSSETHSIHEQTEPCHSEPCSSENHLNHEQQMELCFSELCSSEPIVIVEQHFSNQSQADSCSSQQNDPLQEVTAALGPDEVSSDLAGSPNVVPDPIKLDVNGLPSVSIEQAMCTSDPTILSLDNTDPGSSLEVTQTNASAQNCSAPRPSSLMSTRTSNQLNFSGLIPPIEFQTKEMYKLVKWDRTKHSSLKGKSNPIDINTSTSSSISTSPPRPEYGQTAPRVLGEERHPVLPPLAERSPEEMEGDYLDLLTETLEEGGNIQMEEIVPPRPEERTYPEEDGGVAEALRELAGTPLDDGCQAWIRERRKNRENGTVDDSMTVRRPALFRTHLELDEEGSEPESEASQRIQWPDPGYGPRQKNRLGSSGSREKVFKVLVVGDSAVGKTSFVQRYVQNTFRSNYKATVGVDFALKIVKFDDERNVKLQLWDIAGQDTYTWMNRVYYKHSHGCVIMFDLTNKHSFLNTVKWKEDLDAKCSLQDGSPLPCMLLATKCDLQANRQVDQMDIEMFYKQHNFIGWTETSAKEGLMVNDSMWFLVNIMMRQEGAANLDGGDPNCVNLSNPRRLHPCSC